MWIALASILGVLLGYTSRVQALFLVLLLILAEALVAIGMTGVWSTLAQAATCLVLVEMGYAVGIMARATIERPAASPAA